MEITCRNVNEALGRGLAWLSTAGVKATSRNGPVLVSPEPVLTTYLNPLERVLFSPLRDANPFFHFFEALWMLAGRNDLEFPLYFNSKFGQFSDDGLMLWGAYGYRWQHWFDRNQLMLVADELNQDANSRRAVLTMWDPQSDPDRARAGGKDVPCNTHAYFQVREGRYLDMTVCCRSNDVLLGAYGANVVHMSFLLEFMAAMVGKEVGVYRQFSNNFHVYTEALPAPLDELILNAEIINDLYAVHNIKPKPMMKSANINWRTDLETFFGARPNVEQARYYTQWFELVAVPMYCAWRDRKEKRNSGMKWAAVIQSEDWRRAAEMWIQRRELKRALTNATIIG